jgi:DNA-binding MarR family transcriptional regulator
MSDRAAATANAALSMDAQEFGHRTDMFIRQTRPDVADESLAVGLRLVRAANAFVQASEHEVHRPLGLRWSGFSALFILSIFRTLEARTIARLMGVTRQATSLVLSTLERDGHVDRQPGDAGDRRLVAVRLSRRGRATVKKALSGQLDLSERWFSCLSPEEQRELNRLLDKVLVHGAAKSADTGQDGVNDSPGQPRG